MATLASVSTATIPSIIPSAPSRLVGEHQTHDSDYGSDFSEGEEDIVNQLLQDVNKDPTIAAPTTHAAIPPISTSLLEPVLASTPGLGLALPLAPPGEDSRQHVSASPSVRSTNDSRSFPSGSVKIPAPIHGSQPWGSDAYVSWPDPPNGGVNYPDLSHALMSFEPKATTTPEPLADRTSDDRRSPLERFRSFPKKPLTVTDLSSGAWCELQYWYTLTRLPGGRKTRTAAMKGGSKVHQTLEDQVHTTIRISVAVKEEAFALRIWNLIQGLRTLRDTGMTRELEVWGTIYGEVANGVIDEVSYTCPNIAFEEELQSQSSQGENTTSSQSQSSIANYFQPHRRRVYLTDVKTRASTRLPSGAALRPSRVQLFLYHRLLSDMTSGKVDYSAIITRYGLNSQARFSDAFMAQIGGLHDEVFYDADSDAEVFPSTPRSPRYGPDTDYPQSPDTASQIAPPPDLIRYRSIEQLIPLLQSELHDTFPQGADNIGDLLAIQYRHRDDGRIIGNNSFPNDPSALDGYLKRNLDWWRGNRKAEGVPIEETYKCHSCEFAEICRWRKDKEAEVIERKRNATNPG